MEKVDLLIVHDDKGVQVVEAPVGAAAVGDLVSFRVGYGVLGEVVELMTCNRDDPVYRCISRVAEIRKATKIYKCSWPEHLKD